MMILCQHCEKAVASDARQCPSCGGKPWHKIGILKAIGFLALGLLIGVYTRDYWLILVMVVILIVGAFYSRYRLNGQHTAYKTAQSRRAD
jgi:hypothetical protein